MTFALRLRTFAVALRLAGLCSVASGAGCLTPRCLRGSSRA